MGFIDYIWPHELILRGIIIGMWVLVGFVIWRGNTLRNIARANLDMISKTEDVAALEYSLLQNNVDANACFTKYETDKGKSDITGVLFEHIRAIYDAGLKSSRLDADLLVKNSIDKIFIGIDFLKTSISLFLVIGILGTLAGLAISIGGFSGANFAITGQTGKTANELSTLFENLRGAFAPSMWGVFFTITFVFLYTWFIQEGCINRLTEKLTITTIKNWLPVLYPTDFQRGDNSLVKLNTTIKNADGINQGVTDLKSNLDNSNKTLKELSRVSDLIKIASIKFDNSTDKIMEIKGLYDDLRICNEEFNTALKKIVETATNERKSSYKEYVEQSQKNYNVIHQESSAQMKQMQDKVLALADNMKTYFDQLTKVMQEQSKTLVANTTAQNQTLREESVKQQEKLQAVLVELQSYDTNFFKSISTLRANLSKSVECNTQSALHNAEATKVLQSLSDTLQVQNEKLIAAVTDPINGQLTIMAQNLSRDLKSISTAVERLHNPLKGTEATIQKMMENSLKAMQETAETLMKRSDENIKGILLSKSTHGTSNPDLQVAFDRINASLQSLNGTMKLLVGNMASQSGIDPDVIKSYMKSHSSAGISNRGIEDKLEAILRHMERAEQGKVSRVPSEQRGFLNFGKKDIPVIAIAILLLFSFFMQGAIVYKISDLEQSQAAVNEVLLHGEMEQAANKSNTEKSDSNTKTTANNNEEPATDETQNTNQ